MHKIYKVGGCVRDKLLGLIPSDNDYVVVGSTVDKMLQLGFKPVGKDFPVFLHPITHEEYALARGEKKISQGYRGFQFHVNQNVSLVDDLKRRDITINAIAEDEQGNLIDPFNGIADLKQQIIRHVSPAFVEDPLRVLRVARFSAKYDFNIAPETLSLMKSMVKNRELQTLSKERIWLEFTKALLTKYPSKFFEVLKQIQAFNQVIPEFQFLAKNHLLWTKLKTTLNSIAAANYLFEERFTIVYYHLSQVLPYFQVVSLVKKASVNTKSKELALLFITHYSKLFILASQSPENIYTLINHLDPLRKKGRYLSFIKLAKKIGGNTQQLNQAIKLLQKVIQCFTTINYASLTLGNPQEFISQIRQHKLEIIKNLLNQLSNH